MADETLDLRLISEQLKRVLDKLGEVQAEQERWAEGMSHVVCEVRPSASEQAREALARHSAILEAMSEHDQVSGSRLNAIEARLARIEKHIGLVKA